MSDYLNDFTEWGYKISEVIDVYSNKSNAELSNAQQVILSDIEEMVHKNPWFIAESVLESLKGIRFLLSPESLEKWLSRYKLSAERGKKVAIIMAGNIPAVGFHDLLCVLASGNIALVKLSSDDDALIPHLMELLIEIRSGWTGRLSFIEERLTNFDAVIATGSNNSGRYFEYYFGKYPSIIRRNRNSIAILNGNESAEDIKKLGIDIFQYFGLGCRSVAKLLVPEQFDATQFLPHLQEYLNLSQHHKYMNNYEYRKSIFLLNEDAHFDNGFLLLKEDSGLSSPISVLFYEMYKSETDIENYLQRHENELQCVVGNYEGREEMIPFGKSQYPAIDDYADNVDTMQFLTNL